MQQELSVPNMEVWRVDELFSSSAATDVFGLNRSTMGSTTSSLPETFMAAAASFYNFDVKDPNEDVPIDRAVIASRNHREAERRRRERIKSHLDRLRHLLACDPKIDKASLLAKAVEHVRYLKQRASEIPEIDHFPTEADEITVCPAGALIRASVCCDDRSGLLPELIETLKSLRLRTLRAEMATMGGRVRNVLVVTRDGEELQEEASEGGGDGSMEFIREALKALVERPAVPGEGRPKRRRMVDLTATF